MSLRERTENDARLDCQLHLSSYNEFPNSGIPASNVLMAMLMTLRLPPHIIKGSWPKPIIYQWFAEDRVFPPLTKKSTFLWQNSIPSRQHINVGINSLSLAC